MLGFISIECEESSALPLLTHLVLLHNIGSPEDLSVLGDTIDMAISSNIDVDPLPSLGGIILNLGPPSRYVTVIGGSRATLVAFIDFAMAFDEQTRWP